MRDGDRNDLEVPDGHRPTVFEVAQIEGVDQIRPLGLEMLASRRGEIQRDIEMVGHQSEVIDPTRMIVVPVGEQYGIDGPTVDGAQSLREVGRNIEQDGRRIRLDERPGAATSFVGAGVSE